MEIRARRETVLCKDCGTLNEFYYLSDFSYGERLISLDNGGFAYADLIADEVYSDFCDRLAKNKAQAVFGIACDEIDGEKPNFNHKDVCKSCGGRNFEPKLAEPERIVPINVTVVTHRGWGRLTDKERNLLIAEALKEFPRN